jgi:hypothetical protein
MFMVNGNEGMGLVSLGYHLDHTTDGSHHRWITPQMEDSEEYPFLNCIEQSPQNETCKTGMYPFNGAKETRTPNPFHAMEVRYPLRDRPSKPDFKISVGS